MSGSVTFGSSWREISSWLFSSPSMMTIGGGIDGADLVPASAPASARVDPFEWPEEAGVCAVVSVVNPTGAASA